MRRPLFGNGIPRAASATVANEPLTVLDLRPLSDEAKSRVHGLTLFAVVYPRTGLPSGAGRITVTASDGTTGVIAQELTLPALQETTVVPLLDRYPMRGDMLVTVAQDEDGDLMPVYYYGYFQVDGERPVPVEYRPLQPEANTVGAEPYTYLPANVEGVGSAALHALTTKYIDLVEVTVSANGVLADNDTFLTLTDGVDTAAIRIRSAFIKIFDGIPMRGGPTQVNGAGGSISIANGHVNDEFWAWGRFLRTA